MELASLISVRNDDTMWVYNYTKYNIRLTVHLIFYDTQCSFVKHSSYSQDPKALADDQRGWHQKFTQLVKQPLSKGFLSASQASQMYQIISAHSLSYQKRQYFDIFDL